MSTITSLTSIISILSTLVFVLLISLLVLGIRRIRRVTKERPGWWKLWGNKMLALLLIPWEAVFPPKGEDDGERDPLLSPSGETSEQSA